MKHTTKLYIDCHFYDCPEKPLYSFGYCSQEVNPITFLSVTSFMDGPICTVGMAYTFSYDRDDLMIIDIHSTAPVHFSSSKLNMSFPYHVDYVDLYMVTIGRDRNYELTNLWDNKTIKISSNTHKFNTLFCRLSEDWWKMLLDNQNITAERRRCAIVDHIHPILDYMNSPDYNKELCWFA